MQLHHYPLFEHPQILSSRVVRHDGRKVLEIATSLPLVEDRDDFPTEIIDDIGKAFADYVQENPSVREARLIRV